MSRPNCLDGRKIVVTGAASGIGRTTAALLVSEGARLALLDRDAAALQSFAAEIGGVACVADISDEASVNAAITQAAERMGGIDGVVNAAGITTGRSVDDTDAALWSRVIAVNLSGTYFVCRAALPWLLQAPNAAIVNIASSLALVPAMRDAAYLASKGGVIGLTKALAIEFGAAVRVNVVAPGAVETPLLRNTVTAAQIEAMKARYPIGRIGQPDEIARAILYLIGPDASFVTGTTLAVDGGRSFH
jgi:NAD(P)-dependent dehydrogenase (short-subunit alcohol dehydrogenase family)